MEKEANWPGPEGLIPALPKDASNASWHTRQFLDEILIEERIIGTHVADISMQLWGKNFTPDSITCRWKNMHRRQRIWGLSTGLAWSPIRIMRKLPKSVRIQSASLSRFSTIKRSGHKWPSRSTIRLLQLASILITVSELMEIQMWLTEKN